MKSGLLLRLGALAGAAKLAAAECPNACSGHGTCGAYDMCSCYTGYMANDCSDRVCPFGLAHVDSPKGDLDMDNDVAYETVISGSQIYKDGTSELFPVMESSDGTALSETGHYYMECSNKGLCDRTTATCACFIGYEGHSCQRASCPNDCLGHGVCKTNRELASADHENIYELWDADMSLACDCDAGYGSHDCSERMCPYGMDPLAIDDENTARVPSWAVHFEDAAGINGAEGTWRLRFYDVYGEDWVTEPININSTCAEVTTELEAIPNDVIAEGTLECLHLPNAAMSKYMLTFTGNPGNLKIPEIIVMDEAGRHTLMRSGSTAGYAGLDTAVVYDYGITGEFHDYFGQKCGVTIHVDDVFQDAMGTVQRADILSGTARGLKSCLGDSNGVTWDNVGVENWDYGGSGGLTLQTPGHSYPSQFPHLVKLVDEAASSEFDGGVYAIMFWNSEEEAFHLSSAVDTSTNYTVFATNGILERVWHDTDLSGSFNLHDDEMGLAFWAQYENTIYTSRDFSCENSGTQGTDAVFFGNDSHLHNNCLEKGDFLVIPSSTYGSSTVNVTGDTDFDDRLVTAQGTLNTAGIYEIMKISTEDYTAYTNKTEDRYQIVLDRPIFWDGSFTATTIEEELTEVGINHVYRFTPNMDSHTKEWVAPCANRGLCDTLTGLCTCFAGYTNENCDTQSALAV